MQRVLFQLVRPVRIRRNIQLDVTLWHVGLAIAEPRQIVREAAHFRVCAIRSEKIIRLDSELVLTLNLENGTRCFEIDIDEPVLEVCLDIRLALGDIEQLLVDAASRDRPDGVAFLAIR